MATDLTGLKVKDTYNSLLKIGDNSSLSATPDKISDGLGNESILYLSTSQVSIGTLPATGYDLTVNSAIKTGSIDIVGAATAATLRLTGGSGTQGTLSWNTDEETVDIIQNGATLQVGQEVQVHVKNQTGSTITDGTPVYVTGTLGSSGRLTVAPMIADGTIEAKYFLGITTEDIPNGEDGKVTTFGKIRGLDTTAYSEGQTLYVSDSTAGAFQTTAPVSPNLDLEVAIVINVSANNGTIFVRAQQGYYLGLLHDVYISSPANNQFLVYNSTTSRWENQGIASVGSINLDSVTDNGNTTTNNISVGDITAGNMTLSGYLRGAGTFVIDPSPYADDAGVVQILGDLRVDGTTTTINSTTVTIDDKNIVLASGSATAADANGAGITIDGANATMTYVSASDRFVFNKHVEAQKIIAKDGTSSITLDPTLQTSNYALTIGVTDDGIKFQHNSNSRGFVFDRNGTELLNIASNGNSTFFGNVTAPSFIGSLTGAASLNVLKAGDTMTGNLDFNDNVQARFGTGDDFKIYHNATNTLIDNETGAIIIRNFADDQDIVLASDDGAGSITDYLRVDGSEGSVKLFHYGSQKLETTSTGVSITGALSGNISTSSISGGTIDINGTTAINLQYNGSTQLRIDSLGVAYLGTVTFANDGISLTDEDSTTDSFFHANVDYDAGLYTVTSNARYGSDYIQVDGKDSRSGNDRVFVISPKDIGSPDEDAILYLGGDNSITAPNTLMDWHTIEMNALSVQINNAEVATRTWVTSNFTSDLQDVTDNGATTTNSITAAEFIAPKASFGSSSTTSIAIGLHTMSLANYEYPAVISNNHADFSIGSNIRVDSNHDMVVINTHASIAGSGITFGGNGHDNGAGTISFYAKGGSGATSGDVYSAESAEMILSGGNLSVKDSARFEGTTNPIIIGDGFGTGGSATIHKKGADLYLQYNNGQTATNLHLGGGGTQADLRLDTGKGLIKMNRDGKSGDAINIDHVEDSNWAFRFQTSSVGNDNASGFWVNSDGTPDMRLRRDDGTVRVLLHSNGTSFINGGNLAIGTTSSSYTLNVNGTSYISGNFYTGSTNYFGGLVRLTGTGSANSQVDLPLDYGALRWYDGSTFKGGIGTSSWSGLGSGNDLGFYLVTGNNFHIGNQGNEFVTFKSSTSQVGIGVVNDIRAKLHINTSNVVPDANAPQDESKLVISGVDGNMDLFSTDDNTTVSNSIGFGRYNASTGALIHKFGIVSWANTGSTGSNTGDRIAFHYGGNKNAWSNSELFTIKAGGTVGINNTNPLAKLDIHMSDSNGTYGRGKDGNLNLENTNTANTEGGWMSISGYMGNTVSQYQMGAISGGKVSAAGNGNYGGYLSLWTTSGGLNGEANSGQYERVRIDDAGNVGIGTTSINFKQTNRKILELNGNSEALFAMSNGGSWQYYIHALASGIYHATGGKNFIVDPGAGSIGLGTTSPSNAKVHIVGTGSYVGNYGYNTLTLEDASGYPGLNWRQGNSNWLFRKSGATQELELLYSSNASAPGTGTYTRWLRIEAGGMVETINYLKARGVRVGRDFSISNRATVRLDSANTSSPSDILFGHTAAANESSWTGVYWSISSRAASASNRMYFYRGGGNPTGSSEAILLTLDPNLRVGINNTSPVATLDVAGSFAITGEADLARINFETGGYHGIRFRDDTGANKFKWGHAKTANEFYLYDYTKNGSVFQVNANSHMLLVPTGCVGINTTSPDANSKLNVNGRTYLYNGASEALFIDTAVADSNTRDAIYLFENDGQASGRQAISWRNGNINYYKARIWTEVGSGYNATQFGIDVANDARTLATRLYIRNGDTYHSGDVVAYASDERLKENIRPIENAIDKVKQIKGVHYTWKDEVEDLGFSPTHKDEIGVLAQDVEKVAPEVVRPAPFDYVDGGSKTGENYKTVQYEKLVPLLIEAIKEQQKQIDELKARLDA